MLLMIFYSANLPISVHSNFWSSLKDISQT
jgi:hypothetical protein